MHGATEGVAHAELEDAGYELGAAAEEDGKTEDSLVGSNAAVGVGIGETTIVSNRPLGGIGDEAYPTPHW